jgi:TetR/AcrR family transcriptional regulator, repressor of the ameABC operon
MMARPQTDIEAGRKMLLDLVDDMIRQRGAIGVSMTELAAAAGMSPSNIYRFFESKEALMEAIAENWFAEKLRIMEDVIAADMPARDKMLAFFGRRYALMTAQFDAEPDLYRSYCELGDNHFEVVRGFIDLADHYLAIVVAEAMEQGYFAGLTIDRTVSIINLMVQPFCNPDLIMRFAARPDGEKLAQVIDTIFDGLCAQGQAEASNVTPLTPGNRLAHPLMDGLKRVGFTQ